MQQSSDPQSSYDGITQLVLITLAAISSIVSLLIPALYHIKKQCREHPTNLISKISLLQALSNYNIILIAVNIYKFQSYIDIRDIFDVITFNQPQEPTETEFCQINYVLYMFLELSSIAYNISFSIDLFITLKFPFYAGKKRMKFYNLFALLFLFSTMPQAIAQAYDICQNQYHNKAIYKVPIIFIIVLGIFYGISFFIIIYSFLHSKKIGKVRAQYIRHHRVILLILLGSWVFPLWTNIQIYVGDQSSELFYVVNLLSFVTLLLLGALVNLVRFYHDRFLWERIKNMVLMKPSINKKKKQNEPQKALQNSDIWNVPLATAVAQLNNQKVIHSLIQVVVYACSQSQLQKLINMRSEPQGRSRSIAALTTKQKKILQKIHSQNNSVLKNKVQLQQKFLQQNIEDAKLTDLKKLSKRSKKFNMYCLHDKQINAINNKSYLTLGKKTVFAKQKNENKKGSEVFQRQRATTTMRNYHLSLNTQKDIHRKRSQVFDQYPNKSIGNSKNNISTKSQGQNQLNDQKDNIQIKVISYAHKIFQTIRKLNGIGDQQIEESLNLQNNIDQILKAKQSLGASGSFFFFSYDNKLIIKTIGEGEDAVLLNLLPQYYLHNKKYKDTLLTKIYGLFSVEIAGISKITFILLQNSFQRIQNQKVIYKKYDLKGSTVQRQVKNPHQASVLKDINYLKSSDAFIMMEPLQRQKLIKQIQADISLLRGQNIMDYSLLLGVGAKIKPMRTQTSINLFNSQGQIKRKLEQQKQKEDELNFQIDILRRKKFSTFLKDRKSQLNSLKHSYMPRNYQKSWRYIDEYEDISGRIYSISIIDYLQQFNFNKYMQLQLKKIFKGGGDISSVDSEFYFERFINFVRKIIVPVKNIRRKDLNQSPSKQKQKQIQSTFKKGEQIKQKTKTIYQIKINQKWQNIYQKQQ